MRILSGRGAGALAQRLAARGTQFSRLEPRVRRIVEGVRRVGDRSLRRYAERWDGLETKQPLRVSEEEMVAALREIAPELRKSLLQAAQNIRQFCEWQKPGDWMRSRGGISLGQMVRPLESVGCYVPGGRYPLVSTLLMTVIPAQVAGVGNIRVVSPQAVCGSIGGGCAVERARVLPSRWGAGRRSFGVWNEQHSAGGQDCGARERLRHSCEEDSVV